MKHWPTGDELKEKEPSSGLRRRVMRGLGATALGPIITAAIQLGPVPFLVHSWGAAKYGDWLVLSAIPGYLSLSDLGFGDASGSDMTQRVAAGDREGAVKTFQSSLALLLCLSLIVFLVAGSLVWWFPWQSWLHLSSVSSPEAAAILFVFASYIIATQQNGILESGFRCDGNFATGTFYIMVLRFVEAFSALSMGLITGRLLYVALTYLVIRIVATFVYALLLKRKSPWIQIGLRYADKRRIKELLAPAMGFVALPLGYSISLQGFTILIGALLGPVAVTIFSTLRTLTRFNFQILNVIGWTVWPELSAAFGAKNIPLARRLHHHAYQAGLAISLLSGALLWLIGPTLYRLWIRHAVPFDATCFHILILVTFANSLWYTSSVVPMSTNAHQRIAVSLVAFSTASLLVARFLIPALGLPGAAWSLLLIDLLMIWLVLRTSLRQLDDTFLHFVSGVFSIPKFWIPAPRPSLDSK
jgi:O-antigen/teichoic acid export membrane protein